MEIYCAVEKASVSADFIDPRRRILRAPIKGRYYIYLDDTRSFFLGDHVLSDEQAIACFNSLGDATLASAVIILSRREAEAINQVRNEH